MADSKAAKKAAYKKTGHKDSGKEKKKQDWNSEVRFRSLIQNLSEMIIVLDEKGQVSYESPSWSKTMGYPEGHFIGKSPFSIIHPDDLESVVKDLADAVRNSMDGVPTSFRCRKSDGSWVYLEALGDNLIDHPEIKGIVVTIRDVSERRRSEEVLKKLEERYRLLINATKDVIYTISPESKFISVSPSIEEELGYKPDEIVGRSILELDILARESLEMASTEIGMLLSGQPTGPSEYKLRTKKGIIKTAEIVGTPLIRDGKVIGYTSVARDITEKKAAEEALRSGEEKYRNILNNMDSGYFEADLKGNITFYNQALMGFLGYTEDEMKGINYRNFVAKEEAQRIFGLFNEVFVSGNPVKNFYWQFFKKDGAKAYAVVSIFPLHDPRRKIVGFRGTVRDVTELKQVEDTLRESEKRLANIIDFLPDATIVIDSHGKVVAWNRAMEEMTGIKTEEIEGRGDYEYAVPFYGERRPILVDMALQADQDIEKKYAGIRREGDRIYAETSLSVNNRGDTFIWGTASPLRDTEGRIIGAIESIRNITDRKRAEKELKKAMEKADEANRAKGEFLANISHEIRTPLNAVIGMAELGMDMDLPEGAMEIMLTVSREADHLMGLINEILDFSKIEAGKLELETIPFDLTYLMDHTAGVFAYQAERKGLEFLSFLRPDVPTLLIGDPGRLRQILTNLVGNAIKFTHRGEICITGEVKQIHDDRVTLRFSVRDTGIGIPIDKQETIFESFTQADGSTTRKYGGTGLGTTISKKLVELMGGGIGLESEEGKGSTFWFEVAFGMQTPVKADSSRIDLEFKGLFVLIVDDHELNRTILRQHIEAWGCEAIGAESGKEALEVLDRLSSSGKHVDIIFTDQQMPEMSGFELAAKIREDDRFSGIPIILITSVGRIGDGKECRDMGIQGYLTKPVKIGDLQKVVRNVLAVSPDKYRDAETGLITKHSVAEKSKQTINVLLVDDYPANQQIGSKHLTGAGYSVAIADNGLQAVETWKSGKFDLLFMDIQMPVMDGIEATRAIRSLEQCSIRQAAPIPIIAMTAHAMKEYLDKCVEAGMNDFLTKPIKRQKLLDMAEKWISPEHGKDKEQIISTTNDSDNDSQVFNPSQAVREFEGDMLFLADVIAEFMGNVTSQREIIRQAITDGDAEVVRREAHSIKGGAANLTAMELSRAAADLENAAKGNDLGNAGECFKKMLIAFDAMINEVTKWKSGKIH